MLHDKLKLSEFIISYKFNDTTDVQLDDLTIIVEKHCY